MSEMQSSDTAPAPKIKRCPKCMQPAQPGAKFCDSCGSAQDARPDAPGDPPVGSVIGERYEMGLALGATPYGRAYIAWDEAASEPRVLVASHGPQQFASELAEPAAAEQTARYFAGRSITTTPKVEGAATAIELLVAGDRLITVFDEPSGRSLINADTLLDALESRNAVPKAEETRGIFAPIAHALQGVHATGRTHGRVSPHTIYIGAGAPAMLLDVPAIQDNDDPRVAALLDAPFAAPELRSGQPATPASDVYALAATILRVITARPPGTRSKHEIVSDVRQAGAHQKAGEVLAQALSQGPGDRFASVEAFWQAYMAAFAKKPAAAWPKLVAMILLLLGVIAGGVYLGLEFGPSLLAMLQGGPKIVLEGPKDPVPLGGDATVRWEAPADSRVTIDGLEVDPSGSTIVSGLDADREIALQATLADGSVETRKLQLRVAAEAPPDSEETEESAPMEISFTAPDEPTPYGGAARLSWIVRGAASVTLDGNPVDPAGTFLVSGLMADETHTLEAVAADGSRQTRQASIRVQPGGPSQSGGVRRDPEEKRIPIAPPPAPARPLALSFVPSTLSVPFGGDVELRWEAVNARSVTLDGKTAPVRGSQQVRGLEKDQTFVLSAVGVDGAREERRLDIRVSKPGAPSVTAFAAEPDSVLPGATTTLRWQVSGNFTSLSIQPGGPVSGATGTRQVKPAASTEYTLTATGPGGSVSAKTTVRVRQPPPTIVSFSATPPTVSCQDATQLEWNVRDATDVSIDPEPGRVGASGSERVRPGRDRTYTLTARGPGGVTYKEASVAVAYSGPKSGTIHIKRRLQSGLSFEVPGFPCTPVTVSVTGDPLEMVQPPTQRGSEWVAYFKSPRAGNREVESVIRWTVR